MIPLLHMASLAGGRRSIFRKDFELFKASPNSMFGRGVHFPLRMIEAHMAGLAGGARASNFENV